MRAILPDGPGAGNVGPPGTPDFVDSIDFVDCVDPPLPGASRPRVPALSTKSTHSTQSKFCGDMLRKFVGSPDPSRTPSATHLPPDRPGGVRDLGMHETGMEEVPSARVSFAVLRGAGLGARLRRATA